MRFRAIDISDERLVQNTGYADLYKGVAITDKPNAVVGYKKWVAGAIGAAAAALTLVLF